MLVSYVLRLVPEELAAGRLIGEVEAVASGERRAVHGAAELQAFCTEVLKGAGSWQTHKEG